jgi:N-acetylglucosaminyldiphosphoundecaprenol N-acetyl-beta-D-mannosaminyltransferase
MKQGFDEAKKNPKAQKASKSVEILGVRVDRLDMVSARALIWQAVKEDRRLFVTTPNIEIVMRAYDDRSFRGILNSSGMAIPDSARFGWAVGIGTQKSILGKLLFWPTFLLGNRASLIQFPVTTGTDLMEELCKDASDLGFTIGLLGGGHMVAERLEECLHKNYKSLHISYAKSSIAVNNLGELVSGTIQDLKIPKTDILFVALGQGKQERFIAKNLERLPVKVMIGVGGAFDYLSGSVPRAPKWARNVGLEWLFRLLIQPWRAKRFFSLIRFIFILPFYSPKVE